MPKKIPQKINADNILIQILTTFSKEERRMFYDFLASPFFNKRRDVQCLYQILENRKDLTKAIGYDRVIRKLFPKHYLNKETSIKETDYSRLRNTMSILSKLAEKFLLQLSREGNEVENHRLLIDEMMKRKLYQRSKSVLKKGLKLVKDKSLLQRSSYYDEYRIREPEFYLDVLERNRSMSNTVNPVVLPFHHYYLTNILLYCCAAVNQSKILNKENDFPYLENLLTFVESLGEQIPPLIQIYYNVLLFLKEENAACSFEKVKKLVEEWESNLDINERRQILNFMLNFCAKQIRIGNLQYREERFKLYDLNLASGVWSSGLYLSPHHFYLHVKNALEIEKIDEVHTFVNEYVDSLPPSHQEPMNTLCYALLMFAKKKFNTSLKILKSFSRQEDFFYALYIKTLFIKLYFELDRYDELRLALEALRIYLLEKRSRTIGEPIRESYKKFYSFVNKLHLIDGHPNQKGKTTELKVQINVSNNLMERAWLIQKCK